jgi:type IV pilus biogenesis protein PilP
MMPRGWRHSVPLHVALGALALGVGALLWALVTAFRVETIPDPPPTIVGSIEDIRAGASRPKSDIEATVDNDVFSVERSAPDAPYRMPGEPDPNAKAAPQPEKPIVLGTAVATDGRHFATMQLRDGRPTLVRVGDKIGEWVVRSIERGKVVLVSTGGARADIAVPNPGL